MLCLPYAKTVMIYDDSCPWILDYLYLDPALSHEVSKAWQKVCDVREEDFVDGRFN